MTAPDAAPPTGRASRPRTGSGASLAATVREIERHVDAAGWDAPARVFALVRTAQALAADPGLAARLEPATLAAARADEHHLTSVEQDDLPDADDLEGLLARIAWPPTVDGVAVTVERLVLPPHAEAALPADPDAAVAYAREHPDRTDVRLAVGVLRDGPQWCVVRTRTHPGDEAVGEGADVVPGLVEALRATLEG